MIEVGDSSEMVLVPFCLSHAGNIMTEDLSRKSQFSAIY